MRGERRERPSRPPRLDGSGHPRRKGGEPPCAHRGFPQRLATGWICPGCGADIPERVADARYAASRQGRSS